MAKSLTFQNLGESVAQTQTVPSSLILQTEEQKAEIQVQRRIAARENRRPDESEIERVSQYIANHPGDISGELRMAVVQQLVTLDVNAAELLLYSDMGSFRKLHPAESLVVDIIVDRWLIVQGKRMINDADIQEAIQQELELRKQPWYVRLGRAVILNERQRKSVLRQDIIKLGIYKKALELETGRLEAIKSTAEQKSEEMLKDASQKTKEMLDNAAREAREIMVTAQSRVTKLGSEAAAIGKKIERLQQVEAKLSINPEVLGVLNAELKQEAVSQESELERRVFDLVASCSRIEAFQLFWVPENLNQLLEDIGNFMARHVFAKLDQIETELGTPSRIAAAHRFISNMSTFSIEIKRLCGYNMCQTEKVCPKRHRDHQATLLSSSDFKQYIGLLTLSNVTTKEAMQLFATTLATQKQGGVVSRVTHIENIESAINRTANALFREKAKTT